MIVFDLDGTLALDHHRNHLLKETPKRWDEYFALCDKDELHIPIVQVVHALDKAGHTLGLWSGRSDSVRDLTREWLKTHNIWNCFSQIRLRAAGDRTDDAELKRRWLREQNTFGDPVTLVFEDRQRVVDMWRSEGIVCCQVAPGAF